MELGQDNENKIEDGLRKHLPNDAKLDIEDLLLAYLQKTQELVFFESQLKEIIDNTILPVGAILEENKN
jgi:hypothetical protein